MKHTAYILLSLLGITVLTACSSGGGNDIAGGGRGGSQIGFLTLSITDAPIDKATEVWVQVDGVMLKHEATSDPITISFNPPKRINLLALQGQNSLQLFKDEAVLTGNYNWIMLEVTAVNDGVLDSYVKLKDGTVHELDMPSGSEIGLKIKGGLRIIANTPTDMTVDFDLRKSIVDNGIGTFRLAPVLNLVNDKLSGSIKGTIKLKTLTDKKDCSDTDPATGNAVYLFEGFDVKPDDVDGIDPEPVASAMVKMNKKGKFEYEFGFVPFGKYTVAFTCQTDLDDPATDDAIVFSKKTKNVPIDNTKPKTISRNTFR